jgi:hypothetical protein
LYLVVNMLTFRIYMSRAIGPAASSMGADMYPRYLLTRVFISRLLGLAKKTAQSMAQSTHLPPVNLLVREFALPHQKKITNQ